MTITFAALPGAEFETWAAVDSSGWIALRQESAIREYEVDGDARKLAEALGDCLCDEGDIAAIVQALPGRVACRYV